MQAATPGFSPHFPIDSTIFVHYILPPLLGYFIMAGLAVTPQTRILRIALWPIIALLAFRAVVCADMLFDESDQRDHNASVAFLMTVLVVRTFDWMSTKEHLARHQHSESTEDSRSTIMDMFDLAWTMRGRGWNWGRKVHFPPETRPTDRKGFVLYTILSTATHAFLLGVSHIVLRSSSPMGQTTQISGISIFDDSLPFHVRYIRASILSFFGALVMYLFVQTCYGAFTTFAVLVLRQDPEQWPPAFDSPWRATSLADFWGRRWQQFFRRTFLVQGGYPTALVFGRVGLVIGTFLASGVLHDISMNTLDSKSKSWRIIVGFGMMAPGVLVEEVFQRWTGRKVCGWLGWLWTMSWLAVWGNFIFDGFARSGLFGGDLRPAELVVPPAGRAGIERLVTMFDAWLHTM